MSEQGNYNVLVEVKKTTIWLRKKDAEKPIDGRIKNQGVIMIENKIILIEDDKEIRGMINDYLSGEFEVTAFNDGMSAIQKITSYDEYALALIDLMLPDISGMEIIKIIRKVSKIPIIIITAKDNDIDKSLGLNLCADDYVVKPFSLIELTARIKANIRRARTYQALPNNSIIKIKDIEIDPHSHMVQRKGVTIDLTPIEFQILYILASHPGQAYSKERLYELIWKEPYFGNGAGKSTVMKMILSLIQPDAGEVQLLGEKVTSHSYEIFKKVGSIIENPYFYDKMTARQNLELHCEYMGFPNKERIDEVLHLVDLQNVEKKQVCHYSLGMKQRLAIARAILAKPEFLILDEPINALDPEGIREMRTLFQRLNQEDGTTIFISSHILSEVDLLADTIGIIQHGKLLTELPIEEIHKHQTDYISLQVDDVTRVAALLENMRITNFSVLDKEFIHIYDSDISGKALSKAIIENGIGLESMGRKQDTLEDFFFQLTEEEK